MDLLPDDDELGDRREDLLLPKQSWGLKLKSGDVEIANSEYEVLNQAIRLKVKQQRSRVLSYPKLKGSYVTVQIEPQTVKIRLKDVQKLRTHATNSECNVAGDRPSNSIIVESANMEQLNTLESERSNSITVMSANIEQLNKLEFQRYESSQTVIKPSNSITVESANIEQFDELESERYESSETVIS